MVTDSQDSMHNITLGEIDQGHLILQANRELAKIVRDIADPNKLAEKPRELVIKLVFKPNKQRSAAAVVYTVTHKPATHPPSESDIYMGKDPATGEPIAKPYVPNQQNLFSGPETEDGDDAADRAN